MSARGGSSSSSRHNNSFFDMLYARRACLSHALTLVGMELLHTNSRLLLANIPCYNMSPEKKNDTPFKV